jgi:predicted aldo/keto reductase-like oxidoreductase
MKRREFMSKTLAGGAAAALGIESAWAQATEPPSPAGKQPPTVAGGIQRHRVLGRTGLWVSDIGLGTGRLGHPRVAVRAIELGVNYFDTAPDYGDAEVNLGKALKSTKVDRGSVVITSKMCEHVPYPGHLGQDPSKPVTVDDVIRCCEASLKRLQTDYLDCLFVHAVGEPEDDRRLGNEALPKALDKLKQQGKIRFAGFSSHGPNNTSELVRKAIECGFLDVFMPACNYLKNLRGSTPEDFDAIMAAAKRHNIGVIAMKTVPKEQESEQLTELRKRFSKAASYPHLCFAWALAQEPVAGLVKSMRSVKDVDDYVGASGLTLSAVDREALDAYALAFERSYCRIGCSACHSACPAGVPIADVLRLNEYFVNYGWEKHAMQRFVDVGAAARLRSCAGCDAPCERACPYRLPVRSLLADADTRLSFDSYVRRV